MKRLLFSIVALCSFSAVIAAPHRQMLHEGWQFKQKRGTIWYKATVPGVVHTDLMANKIIEDPFYRLNERAVQWVDKEDWEYTTTFSADKSILDKECIELVFEGLDTYADVYLNDKLLLSADNMFRRWRVDVKPYLREGENHLRVYFHSVVKVDMPKWEALPFQYYRWQDQSADGGLLKRKISVFCRKAAYHYGWDWGPRLVTSGIWRPVYLEAWNSLRISDIFYNQKNVNEKRADIDVEFEILSQKGATAALRVIDEKTGKVLAKGYTTLKAGENKAIVPLSIAKPKLWWSNGLGEAHRYALRSEVEVDGKVVDSKHHDIAVRSIKVVREDDEFGRSFYFELNGKRVFAKGANYIPCDSFLPRVSRTTYEQTIADATAVNMNMLRVWGGGIYENDIFYELCEKNGIMVWQDFMFACALYPVEGAFAESIRQEAIDNVKRLRNYGCIVMWCGNNECYDTLYSCKRSYTKKGIDLKYYEIQKAQFDYQYYELLPSVCAEYDPLRYYHPMSPWTAKDVKAEKEPHMGDMHYWKVWGGSTLADIDTYNTVLSRFMSEYGFQSFPIFESVKLFAPEERDHQVESEVMMLHQKGGNKANQRINHYLRKGYWGAKNFIDFCYLSQVLQGDAIKVAVESHRRNMPFCQGSLFWQHNDCWPAASWASRDYYGRWKAQHFFARHLFEKYLVSAYPNDGRLKVFVVSDSQVAQQGELKVSIITLDGKIVKEFSKRVKVPANTSTLFIDEAIDTLLGSTKAEDVVIASSITVEGKYYSNNNFFVRHSDLNFAKSNIKVDIADTTDGVAVTLSSDKFARAVYLSVDDLESRFEDNFVDILPNTSRTIKVQTGLSAKDFGKQLKIKDIQQTR